MRLISHSGQTRLLPDNKHHEFQEAFNQARQRLVPADGKVVVEVVELIFRMLGQPLPSSEDIAVWLHIFAEYPEDILRASSLKTLKFHFGKPVPADLCRYAEPELQERKRDIRFLKACHSLHKLDDTPLKLEDQSVKSIAPPSRPEEQKYLPRRE